MIAVEQRYVATVPDGLNRFPRIFNARRFK